MKAVVSPFKELPDLSVALELVSVLMLSNELTDLNPYALHCLPFAGLKERDIRTIVTKLV